MCYGTMPKLLQLLTALAPNLLLMLEHVASRRITVPRMTEGLLLVCLL